MALSEAMNLAVRLVSQPGMIRQLRRQPLPSDVTNLLEIAVGDEETLGCAATSTNLSPDQLKYAAGFFIEQILLHHRSDSYRVLGVTPDTASADISRHLRLLMKWVHPDVSRHASESGAIDRSIFANRATAAWEDLKTNVRREAYDARSAKPPRQRRSDKQRPPRGPWKPARSSAWADQVGLSQSDLLHSEANAPRVRRRSRFRQLFRLMARPR